jgi:hypothetical protein
MTWTVACFCGNLYTAPPDRCDTCGNTLSYVVRGDTLTRDTVKVRAELSHQLPRFRLGVRDGFGPG